MTISFHAEEIDFQLPDEATITTWLKGVMRQEDWHLGELSYIFCTDAYLYEMNVQHLNHDTYTDVITFQYSEEVVEGDVFISVERTRENAASFGVTPERELQRVMVHGLLHLMGYKDKTPEDQATMTSKEEEHLQTAPST
ncbi:MAG: rRNA maturation RNase YbeY [Aureispira sp.]